jgi:redox-sensitive bicupin YhaK (pirin superfamily)
VEIPKDILMQIIRADQRYTKKMAWLHATWLFSFSDYYDPDNVGFGKLRVFNDDVVAPGGGFPTHSHKEMEIITLVLEGELAHEDSMKNSAVLKADNVQTMTAGTGLSHSEFNPSDKRLHLYQIWIRPHTEGLMPSYDQKAFGKTAFINRLVPIASGQGMSDSAAIHADATIYRAMLDADRALGHETETGRHFFLYVTSGNVIVNGENLHKNDQARIRAARRVTVQAVEKSDIILIDVGE